ncbi:MAG: Uma2 family endonuclease, partial [Gemmatimonadales bacterium]|nr:Uma2 family endonuclease [Gemmatimonadales bacterium]
LGADERVELIAGQVVEMTPIGDRHASCVRRLHDLLARDALEVAIIDVQNPVVLGARDAPQPDVTVLQRRADRYRHHPHARDILLVIEVADTTLAYDRDVKIPRYARAAVPEVWLVDLTADRIAVYREPQGDAYARLRSAGPGDVLSPVRLPDITLAVTDILG